MGIIASVINYTICYYLEQNYSNSWFPIYGTPLGILGCLGILATFVCYYVWSKLNIKKELFGIVTVVNIFFIIICISALTEFAQETKAAKSENSLLTKGLSLLFNTEPIQHPPAYLLSVRLISELSLIVTGIVCYIITAKLYNRLKNEERKSGITIAQ